MLNQAVERHIQVAIRSIASIGLLMIAGLVAPRLDGQLFRHLLELSAFCLASAAIWARPVFSSVHSKRERRICMAILLVHAVALVALVVAMPGAYVKQNLQQTCAGFEQRSVLAASRTDCDLNQDLPPDLQHAARSSNAALPVARLLIRWGTTCYAHIQDQTLLWSPRAPCRVPSSSS